MCNKLFFTPKYMKKSAFSYDRFVILPGENFDFSLDAKRFCVVEIHVTEYSASSLEDLSVENLTTDDLRRALKLQNWLDSVSHSITDFSNLVSSKKGGVKHG